jgi:pimeloyl-ACP methyl ester carboxylesterase
LSGIGINADCPNLLIQRHLNDTIARARAETGAKVHLIGHSLGGIIARSVAHQRPRDIASVITLAAPFRGTVTNKAVRHAADAVRLRILKEHGRGVLPDCYTGKCTCNFISSLIRDLPQSVMETAIFTRHDGIVDWRYCMTRNEEADFEVPGTHIGMAFNASAYTIVADRLAKARALE